MKKLFYSTTLLLLAATTIVNAQWSLTGNAGTDPAINFIGTTDNVGFKIRTKDAVRINVTNTGKVAIGNFSPIFKLDVKGGSINTDSVYRIGGYTVLSTKGTSNVYAGRYCGVANTIGVSNSAIGDSALYSNTGGYDNTACGADALFTNGFGYKNTACGSDALYSNTGGFCNTANGNIALYSNTTGYLNVANGFSALYSNTEGDQNTANGDRALYSNITGNENTASGAASLMNNISGNSNVAVGRCALHFNTVGSNLVAIGDSALYNQGVNLSGNYKNTAMGSKSLYSNFNGSNNTANGFNSLYSNTTGSFNTVSGSKAGYLSTGNYNTFFGANCGMNNTTGSDNCFIGEETGLLNVSGFENTLIGNTSKVGAANLYNASAFGYGSIVTTSDKIRIGNGAVAVIEGTTVYTVSDGRFKTKVVEEVKGLEFINKLRPVVYNFEAKKFDEFLNKNNAVNQSERTKGIDYSEVEKIRYSGFIAQEVEQAANETGYDFNGVHIPKNSDDNYSLAYGEFTVPLVKAVQELSKQNEALKNENTNLKSRLDKVEESFLQCCSNYSSLKETESNYQINESSNLFQNNPNPFKEKTTIGFSISSSSSKALLKIFSMNGEELKSFSIAAKGKGQIEIAGNTLAPGVYTYVLIVDEKTVDTKQMVITK